MSFSNKFVDNAEGCESYNFEKKFEKLFNYKISKDLLRWCIYSTTLNDPAHNLDHIYKVCLNGMEIFNHYQSIYDLGDKEEIIVMLGCLMHDLGCRYDRKNHHLIGYGLVYEYINRCTPGKYSEEIINEVATCVLEHRSSNKHKPSTLLSEMVSVADSGQPDLDLYINRAIKFRLPKIKDNNISRTDIINETYFHLIDKFDENGYHWDSYPSLGLQFYINEWEVFKTQLTNKEYVMERINIQYDDCVKLLWVSTNLF